MKSFALLPLPHNQDLMIRFLFLLSSFSAFGQVDLEGLLEPKMDLIEIQEQGDAWLVSRTSVDTLMEKSLSISQFEELLDYKKRVLSNQDSIDFYRPYEILLKPFEPLQRQIILIAPPIFEDFPFASLCTEAILGHENYKQHPYIIQKHSISTQVDLSTWKAMTDIEVNDGNTVLLVEDVEDREAPLIIEAKSIRDDFGGLVLDLNGEWIEAIQEARIVHISSPVKLNSQLSIQENSLRISPELLSLNGPVEIDNVFANIRYLKELGTKSMVLNHGAYIPKVSSTIINHFYKNLFDGDRKHDALQKAQKKYIRKKTDPREAHPYYWAGWKVYGDIKSINNTVNPYFYLLIIALLLFFYILIKRSNVKMY